MERHWHLLLSCSAVPNGRVAGGALQTGKSRWRHRGAGQCFVKRLGVQSVTVRHRLHRQHTAGNMNDLPDAEMLPEALTGLLEAMSEGVLVDAPATMSPCIVLLTLRFPLSSTWLMPCPAWLVSCTYASSAACLPMRTVPCRGAQQCLACTAMLGYLLLSVGLPSLLPDPQACTRCSKSMHYANSMPISTWCCMGDELIATSDRACPPTFSASPLFRASSSAAGPRCAG